MQNYSQEKEEEGDRVYYDRMVKNTRDAFRRIHNNANILGRTGGRRMSRRRKQRMFRRSRVCRASRRSRK
jgi:hypothetical protein